MNNIGSIKTLLTHFARKGKKLMGKKSIWKESRVLNNDILRLKKNHTRCFMPLEMILQRTNVAKVEC